MDGTSRETRVNAAFVAVADTLATNCDIVDLLHTLVQECVGILGMQAGGLMLVDNTGELQLMTSTSEAAGFVEGMQLNVSAGPCIDCFRTGTAVSVKEISESAPWPAFRASASQQGFRSVLATPMKLRGRIIGTMNLFGTHAGEVSARDAAVAQALAISSAVLGTESSAMGPQPAVLLSSWLLRSPAAEFAPLSSRDCRDHHPHDSHAGSVRRAHSSSSQRVDIMKAACFHGRHDIRIDDIPEPQLRPGAVTIDIAWCGICGTDLHEYLEGPIFIPAADHPHPLTHEEVPVTMGHEFSGTVSALGDGVTGLAIGDSVVVEPYFVCNECAPCLAGHYNLCTKMGFIGLAGGGGGLSEKIVVDRRWVHPVGDIPLDQAALIEPLAVGHHAFVRSGAKEGDIAFVGGGGPIGLLLAAVLAAEGITVIMSEPGAARRDMALSAGVAHHVIDPLAENPVARVLELTDGAGADVAFECSSINAVLDQLFDAVKPAGVIVNVSIWSSPAKVDMQKLVLKEIDLRGTIGYVNDHPATIALVQEGKINLEPFITGRIALDRLVEDGFETLIHHKETAVKIIVRPHGE